MPGERALRGGTVLKNLSTHPNKQRMARPQFLTAPLSPLTLDEQDNRKRQ
jgi:hypothetical protein